jgi:tetratricopeptide (TPR) repeat protein
VFAGGFYLDAAESIGVDERIKPAEIASLLAQLCDKSLVVPEERSADQTRYRLLETVRAFSAERLVESGEGQAARRSHATFYLELVKGAQAGIEGADAQKWLDLMEIEHDNGRAALRYSVAEDRDLALQLAVRWSPFWMLRLHISEARQWLSAVLEGQDGQRDWSETPESSFRLAEAELAAARFAHRQGDDRTAQAYAEQALQIGRALPDRGITAALLAEIGILAAHRGDVAFARSNFEQSLAVLREAGDSVKVPGYGSAAALQAAIDIGFASALAWEGDYAAAHSHYLKALDYVEREGGRRLVAVSLGLGEFALVDRDLPGARNHLASALEVAVRLRDQVGICVALFYCAGLAAVSAKPGSAMRLQGAASKLREAVVGPGSWIAHSSQRTIVSELDLVYRQLGQREAEIQLGAGRAMTTEQAIDYAVAEVLS